MASVTSFYPDGLLPGETIQDNNARRASAITAKKMALAHVDRGDLMSAGPLFVAAARAGEIESMEWAAQYCKSIGARSEAMHWFTRSAEAGVRDSMFNLSRRYAEDGDLHEALRWLTKASDAGDPDAPVIAEKIRRHLAGQ